MYAAQALNVSRIKTRRRMFRVEYKAHQPLFESMTEVLKNMDEVEQQLKTGSNQKRSIPIAPWQHEPPAPSPRPVSVLVNGVLEISQEANTQNR